jgi:type III restriction enzyme
MKNQRITGVITVRHALSRSKHIFVVAPGLAVKSRLQVLVPASAGNYYDVFNIVPPGLHEKLRPGKVLIRNWHALNWETEELIANLRIFLGHLKGAG